MSSNTPGYNEADRQFHEKDEAALKAIRAKLDADRAKAAAEQARQAHWMRCPKCGNALKEVQLESVTVDQCGSCGGVFFDAGELDHYLRDHRPTSKGLEKLFSWMPGWTVGNGPAAH
jgi:hypothetical protein